jgi:hypothetical protein
MSWPLFKMLGIPSSKPNRIRSLLHAEILWKLLFKLSKMKTFCIYQELFISEYNDLKKSQRSCKAMLICLVDPEK